MNESFHRCRHRRRPIEHVIREITELAAKHGLDSVYFTDELFGVHKEELYDFCNRLRTLKPNITWGCQTRLGCLKREDLQRMYDAGLRWIFFGVESGSPETLERIHKKINLETIERDFRDCRGIGVSAIGGFIIGFPDETVEQLRSTVRLMLRLDKDQCKVSIFFPVPGSELYDYLIETGRLTPFQTLREWSEHRAVAALGMLSNFSNVPTRDLLVIQSYFNWRLFWGGKSARGSRGRSIILNMLGSFFSSVKKRGALAVCGNAFMSAKMFLKVAWFAFAYPGIRKKYGCTGTKDKESNA